MRALSQTTIKRAACGLSLASLAFFVLIERPSGQGPVFGTWTEVGPRPFYGIKADDLDHHQLMSGQPSSIAVDLANDPNGNTVYVGASGGGVWKSTNGLDPSPQFMLISDPDLPSATGAVALDSRTNPPTIYVGTGDPDNPSNINSYAGNGILVSRDGGATWTSIESADGGAHPFKGMGVSRIVVDAGNPDVVLAATGVGSDGNYAHSAYPQNNPAFNHLGIYRSADAGATWRRVKGTPIPGNNINAFFHIDLIHEPVRGVFMAGISNQGLFTSTDGVVWRTFDEADLPTAGLPAPAGMHRISLAARGGTLWAFVLVIPYPGEGELAQAHELYELAPLASRWRRIPKPTDLKYKGFLGYVAAPPGSNGLVLGAEHLFRTDDITAAEPQWTKIEFSPPASLHGDQHAIAFVDANRWYVGDDGGAFATVDRGTTWRNLNATLRTTEFYSASPDSADSGSWVGGQQDNGQAVCRSGTSWYQSMLGDGMYTHADPRDAHGFFASTQFGNIWYLPTAPLTFPPDPFILPQRIVDFSDDHDPDPDPYISGGRGAFLTPYELLQSDPRLYEGVTAPPGFDFAEARFILTGNTSPWLIAFVPGSSFPLPGLHPIAVKLQDGPVKSISTPYIQYIAPVPQDPTAAYLVTGDANPGLYRLDNISLSGDVSIARIPVPGGPFGNAHVLGHVAVSPVCSEAIYVAKVGFLGEKILKSTTGGQTWIDISGNLPNVPVHWITVDPTNPHVIYVGTNVGAFVATDGGVENEQWQRLGTGLPNVPVMQLKVSSTRKLVASTFGRGVWTLDLPAFSPWLPRPPAISDVSLSAPVLTPPDHRMVDVILNYSASDDCGTPACTLSVVSSEPADGVGDGDTLVDFEILDNHRVRLRAERSALGEGRTYTITITCTGSDGLATSRSTTVFVPRDRE